MYESFFEMENTPFTRDIPVERLYTSPQIEDALGRLVYVVDHQMFAVVTANPGCGKSTMVRMLDGRLGNRGSVPGAEKEGGVRAGRGAPVREGHAGGDPVPDELPV